MNNTKFLYYLFFKSMKEKYDLKFTTIFYQIKSLKKDLAKFEYRKYWFAYLNLHNLIPSSLKLRNKQLNISHANDIFKLEKKIFIQLICKNNRKLQITKEKIYYLLNLFNKTFSENENIISIFHINNYKRFLDYNYYRKIKSKKQFINKKIGIDQIRPIAHNYKENKPIKGGFENLSDFVFSQEEITILEKGPKYTLNNKKQKENDIILKADTEFVIRKILNNEGQTITGCNIKDVDSKKRNLLSHFKEDIINIEKDNELLSREDKIIYSLKNKLKKEDITFVLADKSNTTVAVKKSDYIEGMKKALTKNNFEELQTDNWVKNERILQSLLLKCLKKEILDYPTYKKIYPSGSKPCSVYGKIKIHKAEKGFRPIVNTIDSYPSETSKWLKQILEKYMNKKYCVKNSCQVKHKLKKVKIKPEYYMCSLDVSNMYGSVNIDSTIEYLLNRFKFDKEKNISHMTLDMLNDLLNICTKNIQCEFEGVRYIQTSGCSMGGNLSPLLADIQLWLLEKQLMERYGWGKGVNKKVISYCRYVDDIHLIVSKKEDCNEILNYMNSLHKTIKFTIEEEKNRQLNFLDLSIIREENELNFTIFKKSTQNNIKIDFFSLYDNKVKYNILFQEIKNAYNICSSEKLLMIELNKIREIFQQNNYPLKYIENCIKVVNSQFTKGKYIGILERGNVKEEKGESGVDQKIQYIMIDSYRNYSKFKKRFDKFKYLNKGEFGNLDNLKLIKKGPTLAKNVLCNINKDQIHEKYTKGIIYVAKCHTCFETYYGSTLRNYSLRCAEHLKNNNSAITIHANKTGHMIGEEDFKVVLRQKNLLKRFATESLMISKYKPKINLESGMSLVLNHL